MAVRTDRVDDRDALGIVYCARCACDTMPIERSGRCAFCDTLLVAADGSPAVAVEAVEAVVETVPLAAVLREYVDSYRRTRPSTNGRFASAERGAGGCDPLGPYEALAFQTGLPVQTLRRIKNVTRYPRTDLRVADAVVAAIGVGPGVFRDGTLAVLISSDPLTGVLRPPRR